MSSAGAQTAASSVASAESLYADFNDATAAIATIDSGYAKTFGGRNLSEWKAMQSRSRKELQTQLSKIVETGLNSSDKRAVNLMKAALATSGTDDTKRLPCRDVQRINLSYSQLRSALTACFDEVGNNLQFDRKKLTRGGAFGKLEQLDGPARRKAVFLAMQPLYDAINGNDQRSSPYRRLIKLAAANNAKERKSELDSAARTLGIPPAEVEKWLEQILDTWRQVNGNEMIEPWDYRYVAGAASRQLDSAISRQALQEINERCYRDLGADLAQLAVIYDLDPRPGKSPVAYTDFARRGREVNGEWQPTIARVLANYSSGGLGNVNEYIHENGHAAQISAIHTRPAFMDWGDTVFVEALADVSSWNTYDQAWQKKYLGRAASENDNLRALYSGVMLDVAWSLFEIRMLQKPTQDPNRLWTVITSHYLHIVPHPELSWWAVRVQLVDAPGYMVNYGLGGVITADLRAHTREKLGSFEEGNEQWYSWLTENLLRFGTERDTSQLLVEFLGRPVSPNALLTDIRRLTPEPNQYQQQSPLPH
jgi:hypothetical protein